jgi:hypothetical protein
MIEVLKQMIETLEYIDEGANNQGAHTGISWRDVSNKAQPAIQAGRQAIAELESQEPVAFKIYKPTPPRHAIPNVRDAELPWVYDQDPSSGNVASMWVTPVKHTHPPQRTWIGLDDEEIKDAGRFSYCRGGTSEKLYHIMWNSQPSACIGWSREELIAFTKAIEAKYQEKNQ